MITNKAPSPLPRRSRSLAEEVMQDLLARIQEGLFRPGDRLPTEPELMAQQGVSRTVVREAMSRLQASGYVETRHGVGTFVLQPRVPLLPRLGPNANASIKEVLEILELRIGLETEAAGLAALRRKEQHLTLMRHFLDEFEWEVRGGQSAVEADYQFHLQVALATGNRHFEEFYRNLGPATIPRKRLDTSQLSAQSITEYLERTNREHGGILDAITRGDPREARESMRRHLAGSQERLRRAYQAQGRL